MLADFSSWLGSVFFAALCACLGFGAGWYLCSKKK